MASDEVWQFTITTPAHTTQASPLVTVTQVLNRKIRRIEWRVPAGSLGVLGWQIGMRSVQVIPRNAGGWIVAHETSGGWDLTNQPDSGDWSITTYNTGANSHVLYVTFYADVPRKARPELTLIPAGVLGAEPSPDWTGM